MRRDSIGNFITLTKLLNLGGRAGGIGIEYSTGPRIEFLKDIRDTIGHLGH